MARDMYGLLKTAYKADSMERRYDIVDAEDLGNARMLLERVQL
jgi:hypothetical protein